MVSICCKISTIISVFVLFISFVSSVQSVNVNNTNWSSDQPEVESEKLKHIRDYSKKINKPTVKTTQSPDGDTIRRTTEEDVPRASSIVNHEHAIVYVNGSSYYGASTSMDVWGPKVASSDEFSLSQIWVMAGSFKNGDLNSIEAGWQVNPGKYGDQAPRLFIYWTSDAYQNTGCYNLDCPGFVQKSRTIVPGSKITHVSPYHNMLQDLSFSIYKTSHKGHWWLKVKGVVVGYWSRHIFTRLRDRPADMIQFGGEILNTGKYGDHTKTEMGSGGFPNKGNAYGQAACFKRIQVYGSMDGRDPIVNLKLNPYSDKPKCYTTKLEKYDTNLGNHFFYGGPGGAAKGCK